MQTDENSGPGRTYLQPLIVTLTATRDVFISSIKADYRRCGSCSEIDSNNWNTNTCSVTNFAMKKDDCIILVQKILNVINIQYFTTKSEINAYMLSTDYELPSFKVGHSCQVNSEYNTYINKDKDHGDTYFCYPSTEMIVYYYDDAEIYDAWK